VQPSGHNSTWPPKPSSSNWEHIRIKYPLKSGWGETEKIRTYHRWFHPSLCAIRETPLPRFPIKGANGSIKCSSSISLSPVDIFARRKNPIELLENRWFHYSVFSLPVSFYRGLTSPRRCRPPRAVPCVRKQKQKQTDHSPSFPRHRTRPASSFQLSPWHHRPVWGVGSVPRLLSTI